jgi:hypothetical protein
MAPKKTKQNKKQQTKKTYLLHHAMSKETFV